MSIGPQRWNGGIARKDLSLSSAHAIESFELLTTAAAMDGKIASVEGHQGQRITF